MKKISLAIVALVGMQLASNAQETLDTPTNDFNKWSVELTGGVNKAVRPLSSGAYSNTPSLYTVTGGARYMFNEKFGLKGGVAYNSFRNDDNSRDFDTALYNFSLEGVVNAGNILGFREWTDTFNVLVHGGMGYSQLTTDTPAAVRNFGDGDQMLSFMAGITPQIKITNRIAFVADLTVVGNVRQNLTFDGLQDQGQVSGFDGFYVNATAGINIYLGKAEKHADFYSRENVAQEQIADLQNRLTKVETDLIDTDQDGVPDYLDREPNTISGVAVNSKGIAVDKNGNGIPDELESSLDSRYAKKGEVTNSTSTLSGGDVIQKLINDGYVNVYFQFNSTKPETYSLESINYLIKYMNEKPGSSAQLVGYADEIGNASSNQGLSERRAQKVKDIMVAAGISASRLTATGNGEDASVDKASAPARQLVRRVTFKLN